MFFEKTICGEYPSLNFLKKNLANIITFLRAILATSVFIILFADIFGSGLASHGILTFSLIVTAATLDAIDGYIARKLNIESRFGAGLDRIIDKYLIAGLFFFIWVSMVQLLIVKTSWLVIFNIALLVPLTLVETFILFLGYIGIKMRWPIKAARSGKNKMIFECISGSWWALFYGIKPFGYGLDSNVFLEAMAMLLLITNILAFMSARRYCLLYWPLYCDHLKKRTEKSAH